MNVTKDAKRDAFEYARAGMYYGEGAGTRRKLITTTVDYKAATLPGYAEAFMSAMEKQDLAEHADKARKERKRKDASKAIERNVRGISTGQPRSLSTPVLILVAAAGVAHATGYDKIIWTRTKLEYRKAKVQVRRWWKSLEQ